MSCREMPWLVVSAGDFAFSLFFLEKVPLKPPFHLSDVDVGFRLSKNSPFLAMMCSKFLQSDYNWVQSLQTKFKMLACRESLSRYLTLIELWSLSYFVFFYLFSWEDKWRWRLKETKCHSVSFKTLRNIQVAFSLCLLDCEFYNCLLLKKGWRWNKCSFWKRESLKQRLNKRRKKVLMTKTWRWWWDKRRELKYNWNASCVVFLFSWQEVVQSSLSIIISLWTERHKKKKSSFSERKSPPPEDCLLTEEKTQRTETSMNHRVKGQLKLPSLALYVKEWEDHLSFLKRNVWLRSVSLDLLLGWFFSNDRWKVSKKFNRPSSCCELLFSSLRQCLSLLKFDEDLLFFQSKSLPSNAKNGKA